MHYILRHLQLASGVVLLTYLSLHLVNHALGIWSLDLAEHGLTLAIRLWYGVPGTILLYGAAGLHFVMALRTIYERRHWTLPATEWIRLWAGLSLPLLLIRHAVGTRLAASLYAFDPDYEKVVVSLINSGSQGLQLALLAPGWVHGCLGLWIRFRHYPSVRRARPVLVALLIILPLLSAIGFARMSSAVMATNALHLVSDLTLVEHRNDLDAWRRNLLTVYVSLVIGAFVAGRLRNRLQRRAAPKDSLDG